MSPQAVAMDTQKITNALLTLVAVTLVIVISVSTVRAQESASGEDPASAQVTPLFFEDEAPAKRRQGKRQHEEA